MKTQLTFFVLIALFANFAFARIGYTENECDSQYGAWNPAVGKNIRVYNIGGISVSCAFIDGKCEAVRYDLGENIPSGETINKLLDKNGGTDRWEEYERNYWRSSSRAKPKWAEFYKYDGRHLLWIKTDKYVEQMRKEKEAREKNKGDAVDKL